MIPNFESFDIIPNFESFDIIEMRCFRVYFDNIEINYLLNSNDESLSMILSNQYDKKKGDTVKSDIMPFHILFHML